MTRDYQCLESAINTVVAGDNIGIITTGSGNDTVTAGNGGGSISVVAGNDKVTVGNGGYSINTGSGNDTVSAGNVRPYNRAERQCPYLYHNGGQDYISGSLNGLALSINPAATFDYSSGYLVVTIDASNSLTVAASAAALKSR